MQVFLSVSFDPSPKTSSRGAEHRVVTFSIDMFVMVMNSMKRLRASSPLSICMLPALPQLAGSKTGVPHIQNNIYHATALSWGFDISKKTSDVMQDSTWHESLQLCKSPALLTLAVTCPGTCQHSPVALLARCNNNNSARTALGRCGELRQIFVTAHLSALYPCN